METPQIFPLVISKAACLVIFPLPESTEIRYICAVCLAADLQRKELTLKALPLNDVIAALLIRSVQSSETLSELERQVTLSDIAASLQNALTVLPNEIVLYRGTTELETGFIYFVSAEGAIMRYNLGVRESTSS